MDKPVILLTGWLGYIGSHTCVTLEQAGFKTVLLDNLSNSSLTALDAIESILSYRPIFYDADIRDRGAMASILKSNDFFAVIHFAGLKAVGESVEMPFEYYDNNVRWSMVLFEEMEKAWLRNIIFSSSATVYDASKSEPPFSEDAPLGTANPYGTSKLVIEQFLADLSKAKKWNSVALRYFNPIGAHPSGLIGERPNGVPNNLLPYVMDVATGMREEVRVFWNDYPTADGTGVRDYIDVNDLAEAHLAALKWMGCIDANWVFEAVNIGTWSWTSVLEMIESVRKISGKEIPYSIQGRRDWDVAVAVAEPEKAKRLFWWKAKRDVKEAVEGGWIFNVNNFNE